MHRSRNAHVLTAATLLASMPTHLMRNAIAGEGVLVIGGDGTIPTETTPESDLTRMAREVDEQVRRRPYNPPVTKQPDPTVQSAAEAKRARKAAELRRLAEKGAIGIQTTAIDPFPGDKAVKKTASKKTASKKTASKKTTPKPRAKAPTAKDADKTKVPEKRKAPAKQVTK